MGRLLKSGDLTERIISAAIEAHRELGPGLLEAVYEECFCRELAREGLAFERQKFLPVSYRGEVLDLGYRMDVVVRGKVIVEIKAVESLAPLHAAQILNYMKLSGIGIGLLINFNVVLLKTGIRRFVV